MVSDDTAPSGHRVVVIHDGRLLPVEGVCCWRDHVRAAFAAGGAVVTAVAWQPPPPQRPAASRAVPRLAGLPVRVRRPLVRARHLLRRAGGTAARVTRRAVRRGIAARPVLPDVGDAALVIAESLEAARVAVASGVPARRVWALALPAERLTAMPTGFAGAVAEAAGVVGGFLTDSEPARASIERAAPDDRPRVEIFPPLAVDRECPACPDATGTAGLSGDAELHPAAVQLALWRRMIGPLAAGAGFTGPRSFAAARLAGWIGAPAAVRSPWDEPDGSAGPGPGTDVPEGGAAGPAAGDGAEPWRHWTVAAQHRAARAVLATVTPQPPVAPRPTVRALVAGFDMRFAEELAERLANRTDLVVTVDPWPELGSGGAQTGTLLDRADSIFAEWARTSAIWYSRRKRPDQFLAVRLHRFELDAPYPHQIAIDNVDAVVYIAPLFGRRIRDELGWPEHKLVYIPNFLDVDWLDRPKLADARFALGFVGIEWSRKRFDLALDLLAALRRRNHRFHLVVRSVMPWENEYVWAVADERDYVAWCFERIERDPLLRDAVVFDPPGRDMARWFRRVGHVLSTSDAEGSHTAVGEGMASGAVPVVRPWPGAAELYDKEWIHASTADAAAAVLENVDAAVWTDRAARARAEVRRSHNPAAVVAAWADLLHRDVAAARTHFADYVSG